MSKPTLALPFALALVVSALACAPQAPASPTYTKDVQPILAAHCVRCHNETFFIDPAVGKMPAKCHLNRFETTGNCDPDAGAITCSYGAGDRQCAGTLPLYLTIDDENTRMPKPPSDRLNDWEIDVLTRWSKTMAQ